MAIQGGNVVLSRPANFVGFRLQKTVELESGSWSTFNPPEPPVVINGNYTVTTPINSDPSRLLYRLSYQ